MILFTSSLLLTALAMPQSRVPLQEGTATFSQWTLSPDLVVDGRFQENEAWSVYHSLSGFHASAETACWETTTPLDPGTLTFTMYFIHNVGKHFLGRFRLSVTSDDPSEFADGRDNDGDVTANWVVLLNPNSVIVPPGMTYEIKPDGSILTGGEIPTGGIYHLAFELAEEGVTGIRLEAFYDDSLPWNRQPDMTSHGPGHNPSQPGQGNFYLNEMDVGHSPLPVPPRVSVTNLIAGQTATVTVENVTPNSPVQVMLSLSGRAPSRLAATSCGSLLVNLSAPIQFLPVGTADSSGTMTLPMSVSPWFVNRDIWFQAIDLPRCLLSNSLAEVVKP